MASQLFISIITKQKTVITIFQIFFVFVLAFTFFGVWSLYTVNEYAFTFLDLGKTLGQGAVLLYILTLIPGIFRRFRLQHEIVQILMIFRRYIGILMYLFVFAHMWFLYWVDVVATGVMQIPPPNYIAMGSFAHIILLFLVLTSNDYSTKKFGMWWHRIHNLTYIAVGLIFLHVYLQEISIWSVLMGLTTLLVISSHIYAKVKR